MSLGDMPLNDVLALLEPEETRGIHRPVTANIQVPRYIPIPNAHCVHLYRTQSVVSYHMQRPVGAQINEPFPSVRALVKVAFNVAQNYYVTAHNLNFTGSQLRLLEVALAAVASRT